MVGYHLCYESAYACRLMLCLETLNTIICIFIVLYFCECLFQICAAPFALMALLLPAPACYIMLIPSNIIGE